MIRPSKLALMNFQSMRRRNAEVESIDAPVWTSCTATAGEKTKLMKSVKRMGSRVTPMACRQIGLPSVEVVVR